MQISKLEDTLGVKLLERTNKSVMLTNAGRIIAERARKILSDIDELYHIARSEQDPLSGELKLGVIPTLAPYLLPLIMPSLAKQYPNVSFFLIEEQTSSLLAKLKSGEIDAAFLATAHDDASFEHALLFKEEFMLAVCKKNALANTKSVEQAQLCNLNILLLEEGHCLRDQALSYCENLQKAVKQDFRATSLETLRYMVAAGNGITLMPRLACHPIEGITYIPFKSPKPERNISLYWRKATSKDILLESIIKQIKGKKI
jgi:LysR family hydrogen peroxide-inducible transcriptional activator